jgi:hypothetical protein
VLGSQKPPIGQSASSWQPFGFGSTQMPPSQTSSGGHGLLSSHWPGDHSHTPIGPQYAPSGQSQSDWQGMVGSGSTHWPLTHVWPCSQSASQLHWPGSSPMHWPLSQTWPCGQSPSA